MPRISAAASFVCVCWTVARISRFSTASIRSPTPTWNERPLKSADSVGSGDESDLRDPFAVGHDVGAVHGVRQLAHVARPVIALQPVDRRGRERLARVAALVELARGNASASSSMSSLRSRSGGTYSGNTCSRYSRSLRSLPAVTASCGLRLLTRRARARRSRSAGPSRRGSPSAFPARAAASPAGPSASR